MSAEAECAPLPLLTPPAPDLSTPPAPPRPHPSTTALDERFLLPEKRNYDLQYAHTYFVRLARLRERAEASARARWPSCRVGPVLDVGEPGDPPAVVVGTLSKTLNARPSVLAQAVAVDPAAAEEALEGSVLFSEPYATPDDKIVVEDVDARVALVKDRRRCGKRARGEEGGEGEGEEEEDSGDEGAASDAEVATTDGGDDDVDDDDDDGVADALGIPSAGKVLEEALEEQEAAIAGPGAATEAGGGDKPRSRLGLASASASASTLASSGRASRPSTAAPVPDVDALAFPAGRLVTGVVAALKGRALGDGRVAVQGVCFPGVAPGRRGRVEHLFKEGETALKAEPKRETEAQLEADVAPCALGHPPLVAFVSGLEACASDADARLLSLLADLLSSAVGGGDERVVAGTICKIVVAGDALGYGGDPREPRAAKKLDEAKVRAKGEARGDAASPEAIAKARKAEEKAFQAAYNDPALSGWGRRRLVAARRRELRKRREAETEGAGAEAKGDAGGDAGGRPEDSENRCENGDAKAGGARKIRTGTGPIRLSSSKATSLPPKRAALLGSSAARADALLSELAEAAPLTLLPGVRDPCPISQPQQPLHPCLLPGLAGFRSVRRAPSICDEVLGLPAGMGGPLRLLGTSGANVADLMRCRSGRGRDDAISALADLLAYGHLAPTAPDTLACFPFADEDPFVLEEAPDLFFAGNCARFDTGLVRVTEAGRVKRVDEAERARADDGSRLVRLVAVPRFAETGGVVLVNAETLETTLVTVDLDVDEDEDAGGERPGAAC